MEALERVIKILMTKEIYDSHQLADAAEVPRKSLNFYTKKILNSQLKDYFIFDKTNSIPPMNTYQFQGSVDFDTAVKLAKKKIKIEEKPITPIESSEDRQKHVIPIESEEDLEGLDAFLRYVVKRGIKVILSFEV